MRESAKRCESESTMCMYEVIKAGGLTGGLNFDAKNRRASYTMEDMVHAFILGMDTMALGLIKAEALISDGRLDAFISEKYASFRETEIGRRILRDDVTLEELFSIAEEKGNAKMPGSGKQELLLSIVNSVLFA